MKKYLILYIFMFSIMNISCEKNEILEDGSNNSLNNKVSALAAPIDPTTEVYSIHINNGIAGSCDKNILVFPSWASYNACIDFLDNQIETQANAFDLTVPPNSTDDQYDVLANAAGFDEDNPLRIFEGNRNFCSLRLKLLALEDAWLFNQTDGPWDVNSDPDNHFIDEKTERALLNEGVEVIIKDARGNLVIYKFTDDVGGYIQINNMDVVALQQLNNGVIPPATNTNIIIVPPPRTNTSSPSCKEKVKEVAMEYGLSNTRLKRISKLRREFGASASSQSSIFKGKIKTKTKGYKKKNNRWKSARTFITAGINGLTVGGPGDVYDNCATAVPVTLIKEKRRRHIKVKKTINTFDGILPTLHKFNVQDNKIYSLHKQGQILIVNKDFYDMPIN